MVTTRKTSQAIRQKNWQIERLPGIDTKDCEKLKAYGIETTAKLLRHAHKRSARQELAEEMQINVRRVTRWVVMADLARIPSVGCEYCELLLNVGIYSASQLTRTSTRDLQKRIVQFQSASPERPSLLPDANKIGEWIQQARQLILGVD